MEHGTSRSYSELGPVRLGGMSSSGVRLILMRLRIVSTRAAKRPPCDRSEERRVGKRV